MLNKSQIKMGYSRRAIVKSIQRFVFHIIKGLSINYLKQYNLGSQTLHIGICKVFTYSIFFRPSLNNFLYGQSLNILHIFIYFFDFIGMNKETINKIHKYFKRALKICLLLWNTKWNLSIEI